MKIAVFSDIHGNYQALKSILKRVKKYDKVIFLGDAIGLGPDGLLCAKKIQESNIIYLLGNHELYCTRGSNIDDLLEEEKVEHHNWVLKSLKDYKIRDDNNLKYELYVGDYKLTFFHFFLTNEKYPFEHLDIFSNNEYIKVFDKVESDYVFYGHNHEETYFEINDKKYYGIGSSGCNSSNKTYFYSITINNDVNIKKKCIQYNRKKFNNRINNIKYPEKDKLKQIFFGM